MRSAARPPHALLWSLLAAALALTTLSATVTTATSLKELAQRLFPQATVDAVERTPVPGLYEVRSGRTILYMDESGRYVLIGELYDFQGRKNLTAERLLALRTIRFDELPLHLAIPLGPRDATRRLAVFDDVDCPFCRRFHTEVLPGLLQDGIRVYVFLYPLTSLHPQAEAKSEAIWCSADRARALDAAMRGEASHAASQDPPSPPATPGGSAHGRRCDSPLASIRALATRLGVTGTPTLVLDTGELVEGFIDRDALQARWQGPRRR